MKTIKMVAFPFTVLAAAVMLGGCITAELNEGDEPLEEQAEPESVQAALPGALPDAAPAGEATKPMPGVASPPLDGLGAEVPEKRAMGTVNTALAWSVSLAQTDPLDAPWLTEPVTLTATANQDVGPTPYHIRIREGWGGPVIASCPTGTTCSAVVVQNEYLFFGAEYVAVLEEVVPGFPFVALDWESVYWPRVYPELSVGSTTVGLGASTTVSATVNRNLSSGPLWLDIYDVTTGTRIGHEGYDDTCTATVSQAAAGTHTYKAFLTSNNDGTLYPPANNFEETRIRYVTWTGTGYTISLSAPASSCEDCFVTVTATTNVDVGPTPYYITIFNMNGTKLKSCSSGTSCSFQFQPNSYDELVAFISSNSTTLLPTNIQANSNVVGITENIIPH